MVPRPAVRALVSSGRVSPVGALPGSLPASPGLLGVINWGFFRPHQGFSPKAPAMNSKSRPRQDVGFGLLLTQAAQIKTYRLIP